VADALPPPPAFLIIGAQKGATRWLRINLGRHPEIFTADEELSFFNSEDYRRGLDRYRASFTGWSGEPIVGEATPGYMIWRHDPALVAERIDKSLPGVQLFAVLRDPVDRLYSAFVHHVRRGRLDPDEDLIELVSRTSPEEDRLQLVAGGWYARSLAPYMSRFGDRLTVFLTEEARSKPQEVYRTALGRLGVDDSFAPDGLHEVVFSRRLPKKTRYWRRGDGRRPLSEDEKRELGGYFREDVERLEEMLGRDLSEWKHL
jgi:hypothetical protein